MAHKKTHRTASQTNLFTFRRKVLVTAIAACLSVEAWANPTGLQVISGQVGVVTKGNVLTVTNSANAILNWNAFSIGTGETTRFVQPNAASAVLNRVTGQDPSSILGVLQSNGRVFLINPNGILFGAGAQVNVASLVASTLDINNANFQAGQLKFNAGANAGKVENQGNITASSGGSVYLVGTSVENSGLVTAPNGTVYLAAGHEVRLVDSTNPDIQVVVSAPADKAVNLGELASSKIGIFGALVNSSGRVSADGAVAGEGGKVYLRASHGVTLAAGSSTTANGASGGTVTVQGGDGDTVVSGDVSAQGTSGSGGNITVTGNRVALTGSVNASGESGGGTVLIGGGERGADANVPNAQSTYVGSDASVQADATNTGNGGKVVVWSDNNTAAQGTISARGGKKGGNGGRVETSGRVLNVTKAPDTSAPAGHGGQWLLDPEDITISAAPDQTITATAPFQPTTSGASTLNITTLETALSSGSTVIIDTSGVGNGVGNIYLNAALTLPSTATALTLQATNNIFLNAAIQGAPAQSFTLGLVPAQAGGNAAVMLNADVNVGNLGSVAVGGSGRVVVSAGANPLALSAGKGFSAGTLELASGTLTADSAVTVASLSLVPGATLAGGGKVVVTSSYNDAGGVINRTGGMSITEATGDLNFEATSVGALTLTATLGDINLGAVSAGNVRLTSSAGSINQAGALVTGGWLSASAAHDILLTSSTNQMTTLGTLTATSGGIAVVNSTPLGSTADGVITAGGGLSLPTGEGNVGVMITAPGISLATVNATSGAVLLNAQNAPLVAGNITSGGVVTHAGLTPIGAGIVLGGAGITVHNLTANGSGAIVADAGTGSFVATGSLIATGTTSVPDTVSGSGMTDGVGIGIVATTGITLNGGNAGNGLIRLDADRANNGTGIFTLNGALSTQNTSHLLDANGQKTGDPAIGIRAANVVLNAPLSVGDGGDIYLLPSRGRSVGLGQANSQQFTLDNAELAQLGVTPTQTTQSQDGARVWIGDGTTGAIVADGAVFGDAANNNLYRVQLTGASIDSVGSGFGIQAHHLGLAIAGNVGAASADSSGLRVHVHSLGVTAGGDIIITDDSSDSGLVNPFQTDLQVRNLVSNGGGNIDLTVTGGRNAVLVRRYNNQQFSTNGGQITLLVTNGSLTLNTGNTLDTHGGTLTLGASNISLLGTTSVGQLDIANTNATLGGTITASDVSITNSHATLNGNLTVDNTLSIDNSNVTLGGTITAFDVGITNSAATLNGNLTVYDAVSIGNSNATLGGTANLVALTVTGSNITVPHGATIDLSGLSLDNSSLQLLGQGTLEDGGYLSLNNGASLSIGSNSDASATLGIGALSLWWGAGANHISNYGTITKTGTGVASFGTYSGPSYFIDFANQVGGIVNVAAGTLTLNGGESLGGAFNIASGATLTLGQGNNTLDAPTQVSNAGTLGFSSGVNQVLGGYAGSGSELISVSGGMNTIAPPSGALTLANLSMNGGTLALMNDTAVNGTFNWGNSTLTGTGSLTTNGATNITGYSAILQNKVWNNAGTVHITDAILYVQGDATAPAVFNNQPTGQIVVANSTYSYGSHLYAYGSDSVDTAFNNAGTLTVNSGTLYLNLFGSDTGSYAIGAGAVLEITGGTRNFGSGVAIVGANGGVGAFHLAGGTLNVNAAYTQGATDPDWSIDSSTLNDSAGLSFAGTLHLNSGTINDAGGMTVAGTLDWNGGVISGAGVLATTGTTTIGPNNTVYLIDKTWNNSGAVSLVNATLYLDDTGSTPTGLNNLAGGSLNVTNIADGYGSYQFSYINGYYGASGNTAFNNAGTVTITAGTLNVTINGTDSGSYAIAAPGVLQFSNSTRTAGVGTVITGANGGAGTVILSGETINLNTSLLQRAIDPTLEIDNNSTLNATAQLTLQGILNWNSGTITGAGVLTTAGTTNVAQYDSAYLVDKTWNNTGAINLSNCALYLVGDGRATTSLHNLANGHVTVNAGANSSSGSTIGYGYQNTAGDTTFTNDGTVTVANGTLTIGVNGAGSGNYAIAANSVLRFDNGSTRVFNAGATIGGANGGAGTVVLASTTLTLNGAFTQSASDPSWEIDDGATLNDAGMTFNGTLSVLGGTINDTGGITTTGVFNWNGGAIAGAGILATTSTTNIGLNGAVYLQNKTWNNTGTINFTSGSVTLGGPGTNATSLNNLANGIINVGSAVSDSQLAAAFYGTYNDQGTSTTFNNAGSVVLRNATLNIEVNGADSGNYAIASGSRLLFLGATRNFNSGVAITGLGGTAGTFRLDANSVLNINTALTESAQVPTWEMDSNATINETNGLVMSNALIINNGTLNAVGGLTLNGAFNWNGGTITGAGLLTTSSTATTTIGLNSTVYLQDKVWNNSGTVNLTGGGIVLYGTGAATTQFNNQATGHINVSQAASGNASAAAIDTYYANTASDTAFNNLGTVSVADIPLTTNVNGTDTGNYTVSATGTLNFGGGTRNFSQGTISNSGVLGFTGGTNAVSGTYSGAGLIQVTGGTTTFNPTSGGATLPGLTVSGGTLTLTNNTTVNQLTLSGGTLSGGALSALAMTMTGSLTLDNQALELVGSGTATDASLHLQNGASFSVGDATNTTANLTITASGYSYIGYANAGVNNLVNYGTISKQGSGTVILGLIGYSGATYVANHGIIKVRAGDLELPLLHLGENEGTIAIASGATLTLPDGTDNAGLIYGMGTVDLAGTGTLTNDGTLRAGNTEAVGVLTIHGNLVQTSKGQINVELGDAATNIYGQIAVSGDVTLAGSLNVSGVAPYTLHNGDVFSGVITSVGQAGLTGGFDHINVPAGIGSVMLTPSATALNLTVNSSVVCAADNCWIGGNGTDWNTASNWYAGSVPGVNDRVVIGIGATVTDSGSVSVKDLWLQGNLTVSTTGSLTVGTLMAISAGTTTLDGATQTAFLGLTGGTLAGGGTITVTNDYQNSVGVISRTGAMNLTEVSGNLEFSAAQVGALTLLAKSGDIVLDATQASSINAAATTGMVTVNGTVGTNGGNLALTANNSILLSSTANIQAGAGTVNLLVTGADNPIVTASGSNVTSSGVVRFQADTMTLGGTINAPGATVTLTPNAQNRDIYIEGTAGASGGVLSLSPAEWQRITAATLQVGETGGSGSLFVYALPAAGDIHATNLVLASSSVGVYGDIGTTGAPLGALTIKSDHDIDISGYIPNDVVVSTLTLDPGLSGTGVAIVGKNTTVGTLTLGGNGDLNVTSGVVLTVNNGLNLGNSGTFALVGGTLNLNAATVQAVGETFAVGYGATLNNMGGLTLNGTLNWTGGTITGSGVFTTQGTSNVGQSSSVVLQDTTWNNTGVVNLGGSTLYLNGTDAHGPTTFNNLSGGQIKSTAASSYVTDYYSVTDAAFNNAGTVSVENGTLQISANGTDTGTYAIGANSTLRFSDHNRALGAGAVISGTQSGVGVFAVYNGTLNVSDAYTQAAGDAAWLIDSYATLANAAPVIFNGAFTLNGALNNTGGVTTNAAFNWNGYGSTISGSGVLTTMGTTNIGTGIAVTLRDTTWNNAGVVNLNGATVYLTGTGTPPTSFTNLAQGRINSNTANAYIYDNSNDGVTNTSFNNAGTVTVSDGTLHIGASGLDTGSYAIGAGHALVFSGAMRTFGAGAAIIGVNGGAGTFELSNGTLNINTAYTQGSTDPAWLVDYYTTLNDTAPLVFNGTITLNGTLHDAGGLTSNGVLNWAMNTITGVGVLTTTGTTNIGPDYAVFLQDKTWNNSGVVNFNGGGLYMVGTNVAPTVFNNLADGQIIVTNPSNGNGGYQSSMITSYYNVAADTAVNNAGLVKVNNGSFTISVGGTDSGSYQLGSGSTLAFASSTRTFANGIALTGIGSGAGTLRFSSETLNILADLVLPASSPTWEIDGGTTVNAIGNLTLGSTLNWEGGTITGAGVLTTTGTTNIGPYVSVTLQDKTWNNAGTLNISNATINLVGSGVAATTLNNLSGGTINVDGSNTYIGSGYSSATDTTFNNAGTVTVNDGTLNIGVDGTDSGTYAIGAGNTLQFSSQTRSFGGAAAIIGVNGGAGAFELMNGVLNLGAPITQAATDPSWKIDGNTTLHNVAGLTLNGVFTLAGTLNDDGNVTANGTFNWMGGTITGAGVLTTTGTTNINSYYGVTLRDKVWNNAGTVILTDSVLYLTGTGVATTALTNLASGQILVNNAVNGGNASRIDYCSNTATDTIFDNAGLIKVNSGALTLGIAGNDSGTYAIGQNSMVEFSNGVRTFYQGAGVVGTESGAGVLRISGSGLGLAVAYTQGAADPTWELAGNALLNDTLGVTFNGALNLNGGVITGSGVLTTNGITTLGPYATVTLQDKTWNNTGIVHLNGGAAILLAGTGVATTGFNNLSNGVISLSSQDSTPVSASIADAGGNSALDTTFNNAGQVLVSNGILTIAANGVDSGSYAIGAGGTVRLSNNSRAFNAGAVVVGLANHAGSFELNNATLTLNVGYTQAVTDPSLSLNAGSTLVGVGDITSNGTFNWNGGTVTGSGLLTTNGVTNIGGNYYGYYYGYYYGTAAVLRDKTWNNNGLINLNNGAIFLEGTGGATTSLNNLATGDIEVGDTSPQQSSTIGYSNNNTATDTTFNNAGVVMVHTGTLTIAVDGTDSGSYMIGAGNTLQFNGNTTRDFNPGVMVSGIDGGAGVFQIAGATLNLNTNYVQDAADPTWAINSGATLVADGNLTMNGALNWNGGTWNGGLITGTGVLTTNGVTTIGDNYYSYYNYGVAVTLQDKIWNNSGIINISNGGIDLAGTGLATTSLNNVAGGQIVVNTTSSSNPYSAIGYASTNTATDTTFNNAGVVLIKDGSLLVAANGTDTGSYVIGAGGVLTFLNNNRTFNPGVAVVGADSGAGTFQVSGGTLNLNVGYTQSATDPVWELMNSNSELVAAGNLTMNGVFNWNSGIVTGAGLLTTNGATNIGSNYSYYYYYGAATLQDKTWNNNGVVTLTGGTLYLAGTGGAATSFNNLDNGVVNANPLIGSYPSSSIAYAGNNTANNTAFNNQGTVVVRSGTLNIGVNGTDGGSYAINANSALVFSNDATVRIFQAGVALTGAGAGVGIFQNQDGAVYLAADYTQPVGSPTWELDSGSLVFGSGALTMNDTLNWQGGLVTGAGLLTTNGTTNISSSGAYLSDKTWNNNGVVNLDHGLVYLAGTGVATTSFNNLVGGLINVASSATGYGAAITLAGTNTATDTTFNNQGAVTVNNDTFTVDVGGADSGAYAIAPNSALVLSSGSRDFNQGVAVTGTQNGAGQFVLYSGTLNQNVAITQAASDPVWEMESGATLVGNADLTLGGVFHWNGGTITGAGLLTTTGTTYVGNNNLYYNNGGVHLDSKTWNNSGAVAINNWTIHLEGTGAVFNNLSGGTIRSGDSSGTAQVSSISYGTSNNNGTFNNLGQVEVQSGWLGIGVDGADGGAYVVDPGAVLAIYDGVRTFYQGAQVVGTNSGAGAFHLTGGTLNLNTAYTVLATAPSWTVADGILNNTAGLTINGLFTWNGGTLTNAVAFNNAGTVTVNSGTLAIGVDGIDSGSYVIGSSGTLDLFGGSRTFNPGAAVVANGSSAGLFQISGATLHLNEDFTQGATAPGWLMSGGMIHNMASLTLNGAITWNNGSLAGGGAYNIVGTLQMNGGDFMGTGTFNNSGTVQVNNATLTIGVGGTDSGQYVIGAGSTLNLTGGTRNFNQGSAVIGTEGGAGLFQISGGTLNLNTTMGQATTDPTWELDSNTTLNNAASLTLNGAFLWGGGTITGSGTLNNAGTMTVNSGTLAGSGTFNNRGIVLVNSGILSLGVGGTDTGSYQLASGTMLNLAGGTRSFNSGFSLSGTESGAGTLQLLDGILNLNVAYTQAATNDVTWDVLGGTLNAAGDLVLNGVLNWNGGTIAGAGLLNTTGTTSIIGGAVVLQGKTWNNAGALTMAGGSLALSGATAGLTNLAAGQVMVTSAISINATSGATGTTAPANSGAITGSGAFNNAGTVTVNNGTLELAVGGTDTGSYLVGTGAFLNLSAGTRNLNSGIAFAGVGGGAGTLQVSGGTQNLNTALTEAASDPTWQIVGGTLNTSGNLTLNSGLTVTGGTLAVGGNLSTPQFTQSGGTVSAVGLTLSNQVAQSAGSIALSGDASITDASGDLSIAGLSAVNVALTAQNGAIVQTGALVATSLTTNSTAGTTLSNSGNRIASLTATNTTSGDLVFTDMGALTTGGTLTITQITQNGGSVDINNNASGHSGTLTVAGAIVAAGDILIDNYGKLETATNVAPLSTTGGAVALTAHSPLSIGSSISATGNVALVASPTPGGNNVLTVNQGVTIATTGDVSLQAGTGITVASGAAITSTGGGVSLQSSGSIVANGTFRAADGAPTFSAPSVGGSAAPSSGATSSEAQAANQAITSATTNVTQAATNVFNPPANPVVVAQTTPTIDTPPSQPSVDTGSHGGSAIDTGAGGNAGGAGNTGGDTGAGGNTGGAGGSHDSGSGTGGAGAEGSHDSGSGGNAEGGSGSGADQGKSSGSKDSKGNKDNKEKGKDSDTEGSADNQGQKKQEAPQKKYCN